MKKIYIIIALLLSSLTLSAQNLRTGYFLDGYAYRYQFNPAFQGNRGFMALPSLGKLGVGAESTFAVKDFLYPISSGKLGTFLHPEVSDAEAMKNLSSRTMLSTNIEMNLFALGFRSKKSYHTLDLSYRTNMEVTLPGDIFRFMKVGASDGNNVYDFSNLGLSSDMYAQIAYGFSRRFLDMFNIGIRIKGLVGLESIRTKIDNMSLKLDQDAWVVNASGSATATSLASLLLAGEDNNDLMSDLSALMKKPSMGLAFDLGASVDLFNYLTISASILDMGFISYKNARTYTMSPEPWRFEGFNMSVGGGESENLGQQLEAKLDELGKMFNVDEIEPTVMDKYTQKLSMTIHAGVEARLPFYERLSIGALATHRVNGAHSWTEGRFSVNWALLNWFSLAANYAVSDFGHSYGAALSLHPKGLSIFLGTDSFRPFTSFSTNMVPLNDLNTNVVLGVNFPFGKYNGRFPSKEKKEKVKKAKDN